MPDTLLMIGAGAPAELTAAGAELVARGRAKIVGKLPDAICWLDGERRAVRRILFWQTWPGQWTEDDVGELRKAAPLAEIVVLFGPWCEGETRTGRPLSGVRRLAYREGSIDRLFRELNATEPKALAPSTATDEDRALLDSPVFPALHGLPVLIAARDAAIVKLMVDAVAAAGGQPCAIDLRGPLDSVVRPAPDVLVWDLCETITPAAQRQELVLLADRFNRPPVLCLHSFLRPQEAAELQAEATQQRVELNWLAKPFSAPMLLHEIYRLGRRSDYQNAVNTRPIRGPRFLKSRAASPPHARANRSRG